MTFKVITYWFRFISTPSYFYFFPMMIYFSFPIFIDSHSIQKCVQKYLLISFDKISPLRSFQIRISFRNWQFYLKKRNQLSKYQPDVNHLNISGLWQCTRNADKKCGQDQLRSQIDGHYSFEKEIFEKVCGVHNGEDE